MDVGLIPSSNLVLIRFGVARSIAEGRHLFVVTNPFKEAVGPADPLVQIFFGSRLLSVQIFPTLVLLIHLKFEYLNFVNSRL